MMETHAAGQLAIRGRHIRVLEAIQKPEAWRDPDGPIRNAQDTAA